MMITKWVICSAKSVLRCGSFSAACTSHTTQHNSLVRTGHCHWLHCPHQLSGYDGDDRVCAEEMLSPPWDFTHWGEKEKLRNSDSVRTPVTLRRLDISRRTVLLTFAGTPMWTHWKVRQREKTEPSMDWGVAINGKEILFCSRSLSLSISPSPTDWLTHLWRLPSLSRFSSTFYLRLLQ